MTLDGAATTNAQAERIYQDACDKFDAGDIDEADEGFARVIREFPEDPLSRAATIYRARIALRLDNPQRARNLLAPVKGTGDPIAERALVFDAAALSAMGQNEEAVSILSALVDKLTDKEDIVLLETTLWQAAQKIGNIGLAAASLDRLATAVGTGPDIRDNLRGFKRFLTAVTDIKLLEKTAASLEKSGVARPIIEARLAELLLDTGQYQKAQEILDRLDKESGDVDESETAVTETPAENVDMRSIGLLLPLSGRTRLVGEAALKGAQLAAAGGDIRLVVRDSKGLPEEAAKAVETLANQDRVAAIVGPLDSNAAEAAAKKAEALGVPILLLSPKEDTSAIGNFVFREFAGNRIEPEILAAATKARGNRRCGVLYPDTGYGRGMRALFINAVKNAGLIPVGEAMYAADAVNFKEQAEALTRVGIDTLFIPDQASKIALIAPALAAAGFRSAGAGETPRITEAEHLVQLLIPSVGYTEDLIRRAGRYLNGALFTVFFSPDLQWAESNFTAKFHLEYGTRPNLIAAYGHDAVRIILAGVDSGAKSRRDLVQWLIADAGKTPAALETAAPFRGFSPNGAPLAAPNVVELVNSTPTIVPMDAADTVPNRLSEAAAP